MIFVTFFKFIGAIIVYLFMITPRLFHRPVRKAFNEKKFFAHRGLFDNMTDAPENSRKAFEKAVEKGFGIELDVQLTKDNVPVVFHDFTLKRVCGVEGHVHDFTYDELQKYHLMNSDETIPTFPEVLEIIDGRVPMIVELKMHFLEFDCCRRAAESLDGYKGDYVIESFNPLALCWYRNVHPEVVRGQLSENFFKDKSVPKPARPFCYLLSLLLSNFATKPDFIAYNHHCKSNISFKLCRSLFKPVTAAWTIRSQEDIEKASDSFDVFIFENFVPEISDAGKIASYDNTPRAETA